MPADRDQQTARRDAILGLLAATAIRSQAELAARLTDRGFAVTQSSVSRDLRELGIAKVRGRYVAPQSNGGAATATAESSAPLADVVHFLRGAEPAGPNLTVVRTAIGGAPGVGLAIDAAGWPEVVGTIAGDDTLFVATASGAAQRRLLQRLNRIANGRYQNGNAEQR